MGIINFFKRLWNTSPFSSMENALDPTPAKMEEPQIYTDVMEWVRKCNKESGNSYFQFTMHTGIMRLLYFYCTWNNVKITPELEKEYKEYNEWKAKQIKLRPLTIEEKLWAEEIMKQEPGPSFMDFLNEERAADE